MAKAAYKKTVIAGQLRKVVRYSRALPKDSKTIRQAKQASTTAAQRYINVKNSADRLELLFYSNFAMPGAYFLTYTFGEDSLPVNRQHTQKIFSGYVRSLGKVIKAAGRDFKYIYTVEGESEDETPNAAPVCGDVWETEPWKDRERWEKMSVRRSQEPQGKPLRLHVHCFLNLEEGDFETVRELWPYGTVHISKIKVNEPETFARLASYVTKESRNGGKNTGQRAYIPSRGLVQPVINGEWCSENEPLVLPEGAQSIRRGAEYNDTYGTSMEYLIYKLPGIQTEPKAQRVTPRRVKKKAETGPE